MDDKEEKTFQKVFHFADETKLVIDAMEKLGFITTSISYDDPLPSIIDALCAGKRGTPMTIKIIRSGPLGIDVPVVSEVN
jgi:hypothetical protein